MKEFNDIAERWPSRAMFATDLGVKYTTARGWSQRDSIPSAYWRALINAGMRRNIEISPDLLIDLAAKD